MRGQISCPHFLCCRHGLYTLQKQYQHVLSLLWILVICPQAIRICVCPHIALLTEKKCPHLRIYFNTYKHISIHVLILVCISLCVHVPVWLVFNIWISFQKSKSDYNQTWVKDEIWVLYMLMSCRVIFMRDNMILEFRLGIRYLHPIKKLEVQ